MNQSGTFPRGKFNVNSVGHGFGPTVARPNPAPSRQWIAVFCSDYVTALGPPIFSAFFIGWSESRPILCTYTIPLGETTTDTTPVVCSPRTMTICYTRHRKTAHATSKPENSKLLRFNSHIKLSKLLFSLQKFRRLTRLVMQLHTSLQELSLLLYFPCFVCRKPNHFMLSWTKWCTLHDVICICSECSAGNNSIPLKEWRLGLACIGE